MSTSKLSVFSDNPLYANLDARNQRFIMQKAGQFRLTHQDICQLLEIATDFEMWQSGFIDEFWDESGIERLQGGNRKRKILNQIRENWLTTKSALPKYDKHDVEKQPPAEIVFKTKLDDNPVLGPCPVFSPKTRCCNLQTLDLVINCGYDCSYCSIQSFYHNDQILFHENLAEKLAKIEINPNQTYHIGTGQSSDSLLWGNRNEVLDLIFDWVRDKPNVILELKTKSANVNYLLNNDIPSNVIVTWSLNTQTVVENEEHHTAPLKSRLSAARRVAAKGVVVGFHLHPIVAFEGWQQEYTDLVTQVTSDFDAKQVALVSLGTLTFIKPVIKQLRQRKLKSKILQMPFEDAAGKASYPLEFKKELFKTVYDSFRPWHGKVFFYLCMEDSTLWPDVFGYEYQSNAEFELAMKTAYFEKISINS